MALDERFIVASDLEQYFVDKDSGLPLSAGTLTFYRDSARNVLKEIYQLSGSAPNYTYTSMGSQITLSSVGTVQNSAGDNEVIYYYPYDSSGNLDLYFVVCENSNGIDQFTREAWPNVTAGNDPTTDQFQVLNQISNPQFTNVFINAGLTTTYTVSAAVNQVFSFAPNWDFVISGTGTVVIQRIAVTGNDNIPTSPPYLMDINVSTGITECLLRQRFSTNSGLWASTDNQAIYVAGTFMARSQTSGTAVVQMFYEESTGSAPVVIIDAVVSNVSYETYSGSSIQIPASNDTNSGSAGYVDIYISFTANSEVRLSSIQVVPTLQGDVDIVTYDLNTSNREEALQGDYYIPRLVQKRIPSFLIQWDFTVNSYQYGTTGNVTTAAAYIANQTISACGTTGNLVFFQNGPTKGLQFSPAGTNDGFYILQYLTGEQVKDMIGSSLSVNVFGYKGTVGGPVTMRIYLYRGSSAATVPTLPTTIGTIAADGTFTLTATNWTAIPRSGLPVPQTTLSVVATNDQIVTGQNDYSFSGWQITDATQLGDTDKFAIVVAFQYADPTTDITINSVSVVPGDLPCRPAISQTSTFIRTIGKTDGTNYTTSSPTPLEPIDSGKLAVTIFIPFGYVLYVVGCAIASTNQSTAANFNLGIFDTIPAALVGWGTVGTLNTVPRNMNTCTAMIPGDGKIHTVSLYWSTSSGTLTMATTANDTPTMDVLLFPTN